jgi:outer membrane immunogenic protein
VVVGPHNWTGFYVGGNVGGAWSTTDWTFFNGGNFEPFSQDASSWIAGGQVGYRYQFTSNWVWGVEASWSGTNLNDTSLSVLNADRSQQSKITDLLLVTGSVGYAANNWLTYVKGGYANANVDFNTFVKSSGGTTTASDDREGGWTVGGGFEYGFTPYISAGIEYDFTRINIGDRNQIVSTGFSAPETVTGAHADIQTVMARLNFKLFPFGAGIH